MEKYHLKLVATNKTTHNISLEMQRNETNYILRKFKMGSMLNSLINLKVNIIAN